MRRIAAVAASALLAVTTLAALPLEPTTDQRGQKRPAARQPSAPPPLKIEPATVQCRESLGTGVRTAASYCFVLSGRDPAQGVLVTVPPHNGPATLIFNLHNRHTYSEEDVKAGRGFARYSAGIGVLTLTGELLGRGAVQSEFRTARDLFERIGGGAGPGGVKAVAPLGNEEVMVTIPATVKTATQVSFLGELLDAQSTIGRESATPGRPVALVSNVRIEYRPIK
ncbi:MAG: hypothetical protein ABIS06_18575 [Vicinamibacterales bacterium]